LSNIRVSAATIARKRRTPITAFVVSPG